MGVKYKAIKTKNKDGRVCFGIEMSRYYSDVFKNETDAESFADICNKNKLSEVHFDDAVNDYINK